jgi:hypothetical protein
MLRLEEPHATSSMPVFMSQVAERRATFHAAIFQQRTGFVRASCAEVHSHHWFQTGLRAPGHEFVRAKCIRLGAEPGQFSTSGPLIEWTDTIFPVVAGHEISAGIPNYGDPEFADQFQYILSETFIISCRVPRLEYPSVNTSAEMLDETAEQTGVRLSHHECGIENNDSFGHG